MKSFRVRYLDARPRAHTQRELRLPALRTVVNLSSVEGFERSWERLTIALRDGPVVSARLKALPCELECVVQLAWGFVSNAFKLHAGMEFIRIAVFGQLSGNVF
jgi:hypothetical protein